MIISESEKNPFLYPDFSYGNSWNKTYISTIHLCSFNSDVCIEEPIFISTPEWAVQILSKFSTEPALMQTALGTLHPL